MKLDELRRHLRSNLESAPKSTTTETKRTTEEIVAECEAACDEADRVVEAVKNGLCLECGGPLGRSHFSICSACIVSKMKTRKRR